MTDWIAVLLKSGYFWSALLTIINTLLKIYVPTFPLELWIAVEGLVVAILAAYGIPVAKREVTARRASRGNVK